MGCELLLNNMANLLSVWLVLSVEDSSNFYLWRIWTPDPLIFAFLDGGVCGVFQTDIWYDLENIILYFRTVAENSSIAQPVPAFVLQLKLWAPNVHYFMQSSVRILWTLNVEISKSSERAFTVNRLSASSISFSIVVNFGHSDGERPNLSST